LAEKSPVAAPADKQAKKQGLAGLLPLTYPLNSQCIAKENGDAEDLSLGFML
jgi:hypothetical protein